MCPRGRKCWRYCYKANISYYFKVTAYSCVLSDTFSLPKDIYNILSRLNQLIFATMDYM